jgi:diaminopimelate epimerase
VAATLSGIRSPVTVVLDGGELAIDVGDDLGVRMTGWARPVYAGTLSEEFLRELNATE